MKLVVPPFKRRCRRGNGALGAMTAARRRKSRWLPVSAGLVVTKKNLHDPIQLQSERTQKERKQTVGDVNVKERSRFSAGFRWQWVQNGRGHNPLKLLWIPPRHWL